MRRLLVLGVAVFLAAAAVSAVDWQVPAQQLPTDQARALARLPQVRTLAFDSDGVPTFLAGRLGYLGPGNTEGAALRYLEDLGPVFRATGREELSLARTQRDELGQVHVRVQQYARGLRIVGAELIVHVDEATGEVFAVNGRFIPDRDLPIKPALQAREALESAAVEAGIKAGTVLDQPELVYVAAPNGKTYLAWSARVQYQAGGEVQIDRLFGDAVSGGLVTSEGLIHRALYRKIYNGNHTNPDNPTLPGTLMFQEGATSSSDAAAWDCYVNFGYTYNYYKNRFNRDSFDNAGAQLIGTVHVGTNWVNAYWNGTQMVFGDGDGSTATYLSKATDVVAHELTHAVTERTANLAYQNDSGALNEGMSDIFGAAVEAYRDGGISANTWKVGEEVWTPSTPGDALRYMNNPTQDGASADYYPERNYASGCTPSYNNDYCGVHTNSGIANLAFYLLSQGGTHPRGKTSVQVPAITMAKAEQIFYRALTVYMTSSTNYEGARNATAQAAQDLYSQTETNAVQATWNAVGVPGGPVDVTSLSNGQTVSNLSASTGNWLYYKITVPSGQSSLEIRIFNGSGDADLYVKRGALPTTSSYDYRPYLNGNNETVTVSNPASGDWYIGIRAYSSFSGVSLQATYAGSSPTLSLAVSPTSVTVAQGSTGTSTATTTVGGSFNSSVSLSASGVPSGASASFSPSTIAAPGSGSSTVTFNGGTAAAGTYSVTITASGGGLTSSANVSLTITSSGGGVIVLSNGQTVSNLSGSSGSWAYYKIAVPTGQSQLVIQISGGSGDCDLYVKYGSQPSSSSYDYRPYLNGNNETVTVSNPAAGDWYIGLNGYATYSGMSLQATYSGGGGGGGGTMNESENNGSRSSADVIPDSGTEVTGYVGTSSDSDYFKVTVPGYATLTIDLIVPSSKDYELRLYNSSGTTLASSTNGTGQAEHISYYNNSSSSRVFYIRVWGYNGSYSTTLAYTLTPTW